MQSAPALGGGQSGILDTITHSACIICSVVFRLLDAGKPLHDEDDGLRKEIYGRL